VVQGGLDLELRKKSLDIIQHSSVDGVAIGGLSVGETRAEMTTVLEELAPHYIPDKPRFLLGVGTPEDLHIAIENGIDMLDCVLPTRNARHATVWTTGSKKIHLTNEQFTIDTDPIENGCDCYACASGFSKAFLRHQFKVSEPLAGTLASIHNLRHMTRICEQYRAGRVLS
jgi:queuine tRNA-ribosyltransferase